jgi:succinoglycan biosynthesis protein ExoM
MQMDRPQPAEAPRVDVCVCTFRRPSVWDTLASLAAQEYQGGFRVIVADNDDTPSASAVADRARLELGLDIQYLHAPARNISIARNACLEAASAELVAFLDDDETAERNWLSAMVSGLGDCAAVFGPVRARYPASAPSWAVKGDFYSTAPAVRTGGAIDTGYSGNVLMRRSLIGSRRFETALGRMGGEDTFFFARLYGEGAKLGYCPDAAASEPVPVDRLRLSWLLTRSFRRGQTWARVLAAQGHGPAAIAFISAGKATYCGLAALLTLWSPVRVRANLIRGVLHVGVLAKAFGANDVVMYGAGPAAPQSDAEATGARSGV